jgi:hypothetical protein
MANVKIHVYETSDNEYRVEPPLVELKAAVDVFKVKNHSNDDLVIYVGNGAFHATNPEVKALKAKDLVSFPVPVNQAVTGTLYTFQIINPKNGKKAKGNSDPVFIVEN